ETLVRKTAGKGGTQPGNPVPGNPTPSRPRHRAGRRLPGLTAAGSAVVLLAAACSSSGGSSTSSGHYLNFDPCCSWGTTWSLNQYNPLAAAIGQGLIQLPLAVEDDPSLTNFTPQLATSWPVSGDTLTLNLRSGVNWQNGKPVTSTDVYDTIVLDGTNNTAGWLYIAGVSAPNSHQVVVTLRPGTNATLLEDELLGQTIYPASQYGKFVTPGLEQDDAAYYAEDYKNPAAAAKMPQYKAMQAAFKKLAAYNVTTYLGDGPFELKAINTSAALLVKWPGFYDAAKVHVAGINYLNDQNQGIYPKLLNGGVDFSNVYMSPAILKEWRATPGSNTAIPEGFTFSLVFNDHQYPLNMTAVRQAIAYVIPRANMVASAYGGSSVKDRGGVLNNYTDGLPSYLNSIYLTSSEIASLNTYPVNDAKAASLLQSAGFHKSGGKWIMPNGKPFSLTFLVDNATSDIVSSFDSASSALDAFGISSSLDATEGTIQNEDLQNGDFQLTMDLVGGPNPLYSNLDQILGATENFESLGNYAGDRGMGFGPTMAVPGLGTVDIPATIDKESELVGPGPEMDSLVYDWARLVNQQVPFITYATKVYQFPFSSQRFTDWPPMDSKGTSPLWNILGQGNMTQGLTLMLEGGYIRPKS
ncbi:MAG TPA: ABC transporter substrate-binding protein, partial [Streptosporangiaceae bacterium]|nr:ABC transporter substrate-binding protein [Streptosporangiaceae bacterium]